jgi:anti-sigma factor RsiW
MNKTKNPLRACALYADRLVDLSDGELAADERLTVEQHVENCPGCAAELHRLDRSLALLRSREQTCSRRTASGTPGPGLVPAIGVGTLALAIAILVAFGMWRTIQPTAKDDVAKVSPPSPTPTAALAIPSEAAILRQIALIEEQARLQTWLDLMPSEPEYAAERASNEALLAKLKGETL